MTLGFGYKKSKTVMSDFKISPEYGHNLCSHFCKTNVIRHNGRVPPEEADNNIEAIDFRLSGERITEFVHSMTKPNKLLTRPFTGSEGTLV